MLDSIDEFDGLERLFVTAVGLDQRIDASASSVFSRAIPHSHMLVMVVGRRVQGGWLEFLGHVKFDASKAFSTKEEKAQCNDQAARDAQSKRDRAVEDLDFKLSNKLVLNELVPCVEIPQPRVVSALGADGIHWLRVIKLIWDVSNIKHQERG